MGGTAKKLLIVRKSKRPLALALSAVLALMTFGCAQNAGDGKGLSGQVKIDGSSTVYPITEAVSEEFQNENRGVHVTVGLSGTGGGFKKFATGETDVSNASRAMKDEEEAEAKENGIKYLELQVAFDGLSILVNPDNSFVDDLTSAELKKIWNRGSRVKTWRDIRRSWPDRRIKLFGPGTDSGTFDYFTKAINGEEDVSRADYTASEDDNTLVIGVAGDKDALGYFGYAYYVENRDKLKLVAVNGVKPNIKTIRSGKYAPLSRPLFIYVNKKSLKRKDVRAFVEFYLKNAGELVGETGYVPMGPDEYEDQIDRLPKG